MLNLRALLKDASVFTATTMISSALSGVLGLVLAGLLAPRLYGIWQSMRLVVQYGNYTNAGIPWSMQQDVAAATEAGVTGHSQHAIDVTFTFVLLGIALFCLALELTSLLIGWPFAPVLTSLLVVYVAGFQIYGLGFAVLTAERRFRLAGSIDVMTSVISIALTIPLVRLFGLHGLLIAQAAWTLAGCMAIWRAGGVSYGPVFDVRDAWRRVRIGLQFTGNGFMILLYKTADRLVILALLGTAALGYYGVGLLAAGYFELLGSAAGRALFSHSVGAYSRRQDLDDIRSAVTTVSYVTGTIGPISTGLVIIALPTLFEIALPKYKPGLHAAQLLLLGSTFVLFRYTMSFYFATLSKLYRVFPIYVVSLAVAVGASTVAVLAGAGITGVAAGTIVAHLVASLGLLAYAYRHYDRELAGLLSFLAAAHVPTLYTGLVILALDRLFPTTGGLGIHHLIVVALQLSLFVVACVPPVFELNRRTGIASGLVRRAQLAVGAR